VNIDKVALLAEVRARIAEDLAALVGSQRETQAGATHEEAKPESDKDTRAIEASYLARGLADRVSSLREASAKLASLIVRRFGEDDAVALSALVEVEVEDEDGDGDGDAEGGGAALYYFVLPAGAGVKLRASGALVRVVTPEAPVGKLLLGRRVGDELHLPGPGGGREVVVSALV